MSSTNVRSKKSNCAVAQVIPTERGVEISPKKAIWGPSVFDILHASVNEYLVITVDDSVLNIKSGELVDKNGNRVTQFKQEQVKKIQQQRKARTKLQGKTVEISEGHGEK